MDPKEETKVYPLQDKWTLWLHKAGHKWTKKDYLNIFSFQSVDDFWCLYNNHPDLNLGHFYLMKNDIFPSWEDKENIGGERWSFMVGKYNVYTAWQDLTLGVIGRNMIDDSAKMDLINGIEVQSNPTFKKGIIKIWVKEKNTTPKFDREIDMLDVSKVKVQPNEEP